MYPWMPDNWACFHKEDWSASDVFLWCCKAAAKAVINNVVSELCKAALHALKSAKEEEEVDLSKRKIEEKKVE